MVVVAEYIWLDVKKRLRSKTKVIHNINYEVWSEIIKLAPQMLASKFPDWNYDGSSTGQAEGLNSELLLKPVSVFNNPFRGGNNNVLVLCGTYDKDGNPLETNSRVNAKKIFDKKLDEEPWYGLEQEYFAIGSTDAGKPGGNCVSISHRKYSCSKPNQKSLSSSSMVARPLVTCGVPSALSTSVMTRKAF